MNAPITRNIEIHGEIFYGDCSHAGQIDLMEAKEMVATRMELMKDKKHYLIVDISNVKYISPQAKEFLQDPDRGLKNILGAAFIVSNPISALLGNIFIKSSKSFQAKLFSNKEDAIVWIKKLYTRLS